MILRSRVRQGGTWCVLLVALAVFLPAPREAVAGPEGEVRWGVHPSIAPTYFEPAETPGIITPFMALYALHDALVKPMPGQPLAPCLAESWSLSPHGTVYEFVLRKGVRFHNGDPVTADAVKFSFERYRGSGQKLLKDRVNVPLMEPAFINGYGARVADPALGLIVGHNYSAPYEDVRLKTK
jgi:ABC-type transport system substrate-binding protein